MTKSGRGGGRYTGEGAAAYATAALPGGIPAMRHVEVRKADDVRVEPLAVLAAVGCGEN